MKSDKTTPNVPTLRFKSFDQKWEYSTIGKCSISLEYGMNAAAVKFDGKHKYIRITDIDEETSDFIPNPLSSPDGVLEQKYLVKENDILFARTGASVGKSYLYNHNDGELYFAGFLIRARIKPEYNGAFIYYQTKSKKYDRWVKLTSMRSGQPGINSQEYSSYPIAIACKVEQDKIADFFQLLDYRIAVQNKIIEDLKVLKKELCKVILNNKGWPKFRIRDIANLGRGRVINTDEINSQHSPLYPVYSSQTSNNGIMGYLDQYDFEGEYITWTTDGANAGTVFYRNGRFNCTNVCGTLKLTADFDYYITALSIQMVTEKYVSKNLANPKLMNNVMAEIEIFMPDIQTQKSLSRLFMSLDKKIESAGELLSCFVSEKKFFLNAMFI